MAIPTPAGVAVIAVQTAEAHAVGQTALVINGVHFDLDKGGMCSRFVRQSYAAEGRAHDPSFSEWGFPWADSNALYTCRNLRGGGGGNGRAPFGYRWGPIEKGQLVPGDIVGMNSSGRTPGHIGIWLGHGETIGRPQDPGPFLAENTSSARGTAGPGTTITRVSDASRITGYYRAYQLPESRLEAIFLASTGERLPIDCDPALEGGVTRADLRPVAESLGFAVGYEQDGQVETITIQEAP